MPKPQKSAANFSEQAKAKAQPPAKPAKSKPEPEAPKPLLAPEHAPIQAIRLVDIDTKAGTQMREVLNQELIAEYRDLIVDAKSRGEKHPLPPGDVFRSPEGHITMGGGFHRFFAHQQANETEMECRVHAGGVKEAIIFACQDNETHGLRRTNADRRKAALTVLAMPENKDLSNVAVAKLANVSEAFIRNIRTVAQQPEKRAGKGAPPAKTPPPSEPVDTAGTQTAPEEGKTPAAPAGKTQEPPPPPMPETHSQQVYNEALFKLGDALGDDGPKVLEAIKDGSLALTPRDVRDWAGSSEKRIRQILPLVLEQRWAPKKCYAFIDDDGVSEKTKTELVLKAIGQGGRFTAVVDGYRIDRKSVV